MSRGSWVVVAMVLSASTASVRSVRADVISPDVEACNNKQDGDDCEVDDGRDTYDGACVNATCSRLNYGGDGGVPTSVDYACLKCDENAGGGCAIRAPSASPSPWLLALSVAGGAGLLRRRWRSR
jgi:MYXO-CTERM domain-containing protein